MRILTLLALICLLGVRAEARLGETVEQTELRYGKATSSMKMGDEVRRTYTVLSNRVEVVFVTNKSVMETVSTPTENPTLSDETIRLLLNEMTGQPVWQKDDKNHQETIWKSGDLSAVRLRHYYCETLCVPSKDSSDYYWNQGQRMN